MFVCLFLYDQYQNNNIGPTETNNHCDKTVHRRQLDTHVNRDMEMTETKRQAEDVDDTDTDLHMQILFSRYIQQVTLSGLQMHSLKPWRFHLYN